MAKYFPLIWAALWRKPAEAVLIWLAVTASFTLFGLMLGLHAMYTRVIESSRMDRLDVNARFPIASGVFLPIALRDRIAHMEGVSAVGAYYYVRGYFRDPHNTGRIIAVDEGMRRAWSELPLSSTQWNQLFATQTGVFLGRRAAAKWQLRQGDTLHLISRPGTRADGSVAWTFQVLGVVPDDPASTGDFILGNYRYVDSSRPLQDRGQALGFRVAVTDTARANDVSLKIDRLFANSSTPTETIPDKSNAVTTANSGISVTSSSVPVAAAGIFMMLLLTANGIAQSVRERTSEFAVLKTLGYRDGSIMAFVFSEVAIPCLAGAMLGTGLAAALTQLPARYLPRDLASAPKPTLSLDVVGWTLGCALLLALASAVIPMLRLRRLSVTDALANR